jgi:hypothetical protein
MNLVRSLLAASFGLAILFAGPANVFSQKLESGIKPGKKYKQLGAIVLSPNEPDWRIVKSGSTETEFPKDTADKKYTAFVRTSKIPVYEIDEELFRNLEKLKMTQVDDANRDSIHYYYTEYKSTKCLNYDGVFYAPNTGFKHRNMNGYICQHPDDKSTIVQFEFSNFPNDRGYLRPEALMSKAFFEGIKFAKLK